MPAGQHSLLALVKDNSIGRFDANWFSLCLPAFWHSCKMSAFFVTCPEKVSVVVIVPFPGGQIFWFDHSGSGLFSLTGCTHWSRNLVGQRLASLAGACQLSAHVLLLSSELSFANSVQCFLFFASLQCQLGVCVLVDCSNEWSMHRRRACEQKRKGNAAALSVLHKCVTAVCPLFFNSFTVCKSARVNCSLLWSHWWTALTGVLHHCSIAVHSFQSVSVLTPPLQFTDSISPDSHSSPPSAHLHQTEKHWHSLALAH